MKNSARNRFKWAVLLLVPIIVFVVMLLIARERRRTVMTQEFLRAIQRGQMGLSLDEAKDFVAQGADVNGVVTDENDVNKGKTALHIVAARGHIEPITYFLLEQGADVNATDDSGWTPLMIASQSGPEAVQFFIDKGAALNLKSKPQTLGDDTVVKRRTALNIAIVTSESKRAKSYGAGPELEEGVRILKAAGAKE